MFPDLTSEEPAHDPREYAAYARLDSILSDYAVLRAFAVLALPSAELPCACTAQNPGECLRCQTELIVAKDRAALGRG